MSLSSARAVRAAITAGTLRGDAFRDALLAVPADDRDAWVDEVLDLGEAPPDEGLPPGGVPYLPAGVAEILDAVREVPISATDTFVDLGSGVGRVVMLVHLLTGARARGIEIQRALVERARDCAAKLRLTGVSFEHADASTAELDGSVLFLYAPFNGELLRRVLRRLEQLAQRRPFKICTVDLVLPVEGWFRVREPANLSLSIYEAGRTP